MGKSPVLDADGDQGIHQILENFEIFMGIDERTKNGSVVEKYKLCAPRYRELIY